MSRFRGIADHDVEQEVIDLLQKWPVFISLLFFEEASVSDFERFNLQKMRQRPEDMQSDH